jgi:hypothetical protein
VIVEKLEENICNICQDKCFLKKVKDKNTKHPVEKWEKTWQFPGVFLNVHLHSFNKCKLKQY